jgi:two-component system response regulator PilR (NtrC family)
LGSETYWRPVSAAKSVLVVDDDTAIRAMVRAILVREGFEVEGVSSGNEAIARMNERRYDAVVLDMMMTNGSGEAVLENLADHRPDVKCVVIMTAGSPANIERIEVSNVQTKLRKPFDIDELLDAVRKCVST